MSVMEEEQDRFRPILGVKKYFRKNHTFYITAVKVGGKINASYYYLKQILTQISVQVAQIKQDQNLSDDAVV